MKFEWPSPSLSTAAHAVVITVYQTIPRSRAFKGIQGHSRVREQWVRGIQKLLKYPWGRGWNDSLSGISCKHCRMSCVQAVILRPHASTSSHQDSSYENAPKGGTQRRHICMPKAYTNELPAFDSERGSPSVQVYSDADLCIHYFKFTVDMAKIDMIETVDMYQRA